MGCFVASTIHSLYAQVITLRQRFTALLCDSKQKKNSYYAMDRTRLFCTQSFALWAEFPNVERKKMIIWFVIPVVSL